MHEPGLIWIALGMLALFCSIIFGCIGWTWVKTSNRKAANESVCIVCDDEAPARCSKCPNSLLHERIEAEAATA
jgi:hypothetical protein